LFVLYFRIIKQPRPTRLLPAALRGVSKYAHQVNIDFFKDLMGVLKTLIAYRPDEQGASITEAEDEDGLSNTDHMRHRLLCIVTAFELLSGQGKCRSLIDRLIPPPKLIPFLFLSSHIMTQ
jgi:nucleolar complex protein 3